VAGNMAFSLIFSVIDAATAPIKAIAAALNEPTQAAGAVGEAGEKAGTRLSGGMDRARGAIHRLGDSFKNPISRLAELSKAAGEASEKFARSFTGMGALVAEGFSVKDVAGQAEFWRRMQINTGMTSAAIDKLKGGINGAVVEFGIGQGAMMDAFKSFKASGGTAAVFEGNARTIAAAIQLMGGHAEETGKLFSTLQTKMHLEKPEDFLTTTALIRKQLAGIDGGFDAFAEASDRLGDSMEALGMKGPQAAAALGAVYGVAAKGTGGNGRKAMISTEGWLGDLTHRDYQAQLSQGLGERITDANGRVKDPRELMQKMAAKYAEAMKLPENQQVAAIARLDSLFGESAAKMFKAVGGEIKATGTSATMDRILGAKGDGAELMEKAARAGEGLSASLNRLRAGMAIAAESVFTGPIELFADAMNACGGVIGKVVLGLAALAAVGHTITWIAGAIEGFKLLQVTLLTFRFSAFISGLGAVATGLVPVIAATWAWTAALLANPVVWIVLAVVAAVAAVGVAIYALYKHWDEIWSAIGGVVKAAILPVVALGTAIKDALGGAWDWVGAKCAAVIDWCAQKLDALFDKMKLAKDWIANTTRPARQAVKHAVAAVAHSAPGRVIGDAAQQAIAFFKDKGWTHQQAAGIAASFQAESSFNPGAVGDNGRAYGLGQWHPDRQAAFAQWAGHDIRQSTMDEQLGFAHFELTQGNERAAGQALAQTSTAAEAGAVVSKRYERPADREGEAGRRAASAEAISALAPQPLSRADLPPSAVHKSEGVIVVRFDNLPKGAVPQVANQSSNLSLRLDRGPSMAAG
jgi:Phage tail lysozyme